MKKEKQIYNESYVNRLKWFNDGVIAIIITILILNINIWSYQSNVSSEIFMQKLNEVWPNIFSYIISFYVIWKFWFYNLKLFEHLKSINTSFIFCNFVFLFSLSLMPFATSLIGDYYYLKIAIILYLLSLMFVSISSTILQFFAYKSQHLLKTNIDKKSIYNWLSTPIAILIIMIFVLFNNNYFENYYLLYLIPIIIFLVKKIFNKI